MCLVAPNVLAVMQQTSAIGRKSPALLLWYLRALRLRRFMRLSHAGYSGLIRFMSIEVAAGQGRSIFDMESGKGGQMKAARVLRFGPPSVIRNDELPKPYPAAGELLVRVKAAGVGNWDALIREGRVALQPLPIVLGSELSGIVEAIGTGVLGFKLGDEVYGATNEQFSGAYAEYALPLARMIAQKPKTLNFIQAASVPIVAATAWQMLFDYARVTAGQTVLIHGGAGNVGAYVPFVEFSECSGVAPLCREHEASFGVALGAFALT